MFRTLGEKLKELFNLGAGAPEFYENLEDALIEGDVGASTASEIVRSLKEEAKKSGLRTREDLVAEIRRSLGGLVKSSPLDLADGLNVFLVLGVNGVGKTTTIAKLADYYRREKKIEGIVLSAGDTFRAGAIEQLSLHGSRLGIRVVSQAAGADPGAVVYDSIESAKARGERLVLADTAGRMHNKTNLIRELQKIDKIVQSRIEGGTYRKVLVIDAVTGQNGLRQAEIFHEAVKIDSIVLTKYDGTAKGGIAVAISRDLGIPISFVGVGEKIADLKPFDKEVYLDGLLGKA